MFMPVELNLSPMDENTHQGYEGAEDFGDQTAPLLGVFYLDDEETTLIIAGGRAEICNGSGEPWFFLEVSKDCHIEAVVKVTATLQNSFCNGSVRSGFLESNGWKTA